MPGASQKAGLLGQVYERQISRLPFPAVQSKRQSLCISQPDSRQRKGVQDLRDTLRDTQVFPDSSTQPLTPPTREYDFTTYLQVRYQIPALWNMVPGLNSGIKDHALKSLYFVPKLFTQSRRLSLSKCFTN